MRPTSRALTAPVVGGCHCRAKQHALPWRSLLVRPQSPRPGLELGLTLGRSVAASVGGRGRGAHGWNRAVSGDADSNYQRVVGGVVHSADERPSGVDDVVSAAVSPERTTRTPAVGLAPGAFRFQLAASVGSAPASPSAPSRPPAGWCSPVKVLLALLATGIASVLAACIAGFLVAVRELVRACREATIASRAVVTAAESINAAAGALQVTLAKADDLLEDVENIGQSTASVFETATREAGLLQRRLSDLPNTASRTLMEAITQQYALPSGEYDSDSDVQSGVWVGDVKIEIGNKIEGYREGSKWFEGNPGVNFNFSRSNRFRTGEYCAVPRTDKTYTWGVIELNDEDYSIDYSEDIDQDGVSDVGEPSGLSCEWPPKDPNEVKKMGKNNLLASSDDAPLGGGFSWLEKQMAAAGREKDMEKVEALVRSLTGLTREVESEYKVVVELDTNVYSYKIMNAGDLGKLLGKRLRA